MSIVLKALHPRGRVAASAALMAAVAAATFLPASGAAAADAFGQAETLLKSPGMPGILSKYLQDSTGEPAGNGHGGRQCRARRRRFLRRGPVVHYACRHERVQRLRTPIRRTTRRARGGDHRARGAERARSWSAGRPRRATTRWTEDQNGASSRRRRLRLVKVGTRTHAWFNYFGDPDSARPGCCSGEDLIYGRFRRPITPASLRAAGGRKILDQPPR